MTYSIRLLGILFIAFGGAKLAGAALVWETTRIDRTAEPNTPAIEADFRFRNSGERPVTIVSLTPNCGCTAAETDRKTYASGESGRIKVVFTPGSRTGLQYKSVIVQDDTTSEPTNLELRVAIQEFITLEPRLLEWTATANPGEKSILCKAEGKDEFEILGVDSSNPSFIARFEIIRPRREFVVYVKPSVGREDQATNISIRIRSSQGVIRNLDAQASIK
jgi:hypothetical protein